MSNERLFTLLKRAKLVTFAKVHASAFTVTASLVSLPIVVLPLSVVTPATVSVPVKFAALEMVCEL